MNAHSLIIRKVLAIVAILMAAYGALHAQEFGKITSAEVAEAKHPDYPDAKAAYLVRNCSIEYDLESRNSELVVNYFYRIKIYNEEGLNEFADWQVLLHKNGKDKENIRNIDARTYTIEDGVVVTTELNKSDIYKEEESEYRNMVRFALPKVKVGSVIDLKYTLRSPFLYSTPKHYFQMEVPVSYSELTIYVPDYFTMTPVATGVVSLSKDEKEISFRKELKTTFTATRVPPIMPDEYVLNINDYRSSLKYELQSIARPGYPVRIFSESWEAIGEKLAKHDKVGKILDDKVKGSEALIAEASKMEAAEAVVHIYEYVRKHIAWNDNIGVYADQKLTSVWESKQGSVPDINLLIINLLRKAGVKAYPVATKYRSSGMLNRYYPSLTELSYLVAYVEIDGKSMLVDATSKYAPAGELPLRANNLYGLLIKDGTGEIINIENNKKATTRKVVKLTIDTENVSLVGEGSIQHKGYAATRSRRKAEEEDVEDQQSLTTEKEQEEEDEEEEEEEESVVAREDVTQYTSTEGFEDVYSPIRSEFSTTIYNAIQGIGDELFIDAFVITNFEENPFVNEQREYPAFFNCEHDHMYVSVIEKPQGYKLVTVPEEVSFVMEKGQGSFLYSATEDDEKISIRCVLKINEKTFLPAAYDMLRRFFDAILDKQREKLVFKKV